MKCCRCPCAKNGCADAVAGRPQKCADSWSADGCGCCADLKSGFPQHAHSGRLASMASQRPHSRCLLASCLLRELRRLVTFEGLQLTMRLHSAHYQHKYGSGSPGNFFASYALKSYSDLPPSCCHICMIRCLSSACLAHAHPLAALESKVTTHCSCH